MGLRWRGTYDPGGRQAGVDLDPQRFAVKVVVDVERPEPPIRSQGIDQSVCRPRVINEFFCSNLYIHNYLL